MQQPNASAAPCRSWRQKQDAIFASRTTAGRMRGAEAVRRSLLPRAIPDSSRRRVVGIAARCSAAPERAIDDLTTKWIAAIASRREQKLPSAAKFDSSGWIRTTDLTIMSRAL
jgi:hypothetical protein